jgi:formate/nitrite transporter FocA (FNT family)
MKPPVSHLETPTPLTVTFEAVMPAAMAVLAEESGIKRASLDPMASFVLSVLAGAFVAFGAIFATTVLAGTMTTFTADGTLASSAVLPYGIGRLLAGLAFCVGIIAVIIAGAELFTGNNLIVMAWASGKVTTSALMFNWVLVLTGNCAGAVLTAGLMFLTTQYTFGGGAVGLVALNTANAKAALPLVPAFTLGIMCNALVCLAVLDVLQRQDECRSRVDGRATGRSLRRGRVRALHRERLLHSDRAVHQGRCAGLVLEIGKQDCGGFSGPDMEQFHLQSRSGYGREHPRRLSHGRRRLLVCVPSEENGRAALLNRERLGDALLRRLRVRIKRRHFRLLLRKSGSLDSKELGDAL